MAQASSNLVKLYIRFQMKALIGLIGFVLVPYILLSTFYPKVPHMQYYFLGVLFAIKLFAFNDDVYKKSLIKFLPSYFNSNANNLIYPSAQAVVKMRNANLVIVGIIILITGFIV